MHRTYRRPFRFIALAFVAIMILGFIFMGGRSRSQSAWMEGYMMGRLSAGEDGGNAIPYYGHRGFMGSGLHALGGLIPMLLCGGLLLLLGLIFLPLMFFGMLFGRRRWHQPDKRWAKHWKKHWRHGPRPPWCWDQEDEDEDDGEPSAEEPEEPR